MLKSKKQSNLDGKRVIRTRRFPTLREPIGDNENCTSPILEIRQQIFFLIMVRKFELIPILGLKFFVIKWKQMLISSNENVSFFDIKSLIWNQQNSLKLQGSKLASVSQLRVFFKKIPQEFRRIDVLLYAATKSSFFATCGSKHFEKAYKNQFLIFVIVVICRSCRKSYFTFPRTKSSKKVKTLSKSLAESQFFHQKDCSNSTPLGRFFKFQVRFSWWTIIMVFLYYTEI